MIHVGVDLVHVSRIEEILKNSHDSFLKRICTPSEIQRVAYERQKAEKIAGVYAAKEAFSKAIGTGIGDKLSFQDVELNYSPAGGPIASYIGEKFKSKAQKWNISCSISHDNNMVMACVVILGEL